LRGRERRRARSGAWGRIAERTTSTKVHRIDYTGLINYWGHVLDGYTYTHRPLSLRTNIVRDFGLTNNSVIVGYDSINQLISWSAKESGGSPRLNEQLGLGFDRAHNLQYRTNGFLVQTFTCDPVNELTNITPYGQRTHAASW